ncbi:hypothetical protein EDC01DRAFT_208122 [Geopyxis carbonaria]|nr:hypothetical protein EDC01DRAFT_208122 [Geopyxis carbonaria]
MTGTAAIISLLQPPIMSASNQSTITPQSIQTIGNTSAEQLKYLDLVIDRYHECLLRNLDEVFPEIELPAPSNYVNPRAMQTIGNAFSAEQLEFLQFAIDRDHQFRLRFRLRNCHEVFPGTELPVPINLVNTPICIINLTIDNMEARLDNYGKLCRVLWLNVAEVIFADKALKLLSDPDKYSRETRFFMRVLQSMDKTP